jgi:hypothetical protein
MKKTVLTFGLISGAMLCAMFLMTLPFHDVIGWDWGMVVGYTSMVLAFLLVYFGVRSYRDNVAGGRVGFFRALAVGALIALVSSACYVAMWQVVYFNFMPNFLTEYQAHAAAKARAEGVSEAVIAQQQKEMEEFEVMYQNPAINAAITFLEPLPVALVMVLVSAGVLSRSKRPDGAEGTLAGTRVSG